MYLELENKPESKIAAVDTSGSSVRYGELVEFSKRFGELFPDRTMVIILCRNDIPTLKVYLACMENRIVPLLIGEKTDPEAMIKFVYTYHPSYIMGHREALGKISFEQATEIVSDTGFCAAKTEMAPFPLYPELSLLLTTSGSTGSPKLVRHSYSNLTEQAKNISTFFEMDGTERPMVDLPIMYTMGLSIINSHLYSGGTVLLSDESVLSKRFWEFFKEQGATSFTGVPYSFELLKRIRLTRMDLPSLNMLSQGGGKLARELQLEFANYIIGKGGRYIATYGQTECSARMAYLPSRLAIEKCGSIGRAIPNGKLYLKDDNGNLITEPNIQGEMYYEGPNVTLGYAVKGEELALGDERHGVMATGDIAYMDEDGYFYISGRKKRFLKLYGYRISLDECESIIKGAFRIECACTGNDKKMTIFITDESYKDAAKTLLLGKTNLYSPAVDVIVLEKLPRNDAGKVLYAKLDEFLEDR